MVYKHLLAMLVAVLIIAARVAAPEIITHLESFGRTLGPKPIYFLDHVLPPFAVAHKVLASTTLVYMIHSLLELNTTLFLHLRVYMHPRRRSMGDEIVRGFIRYFDRSQFPVLNRLHSRRLVNSWSLFLDLSLIHI